MHRELVAVHAAIRAHMNRVMMHHDAAVRRHPVADDRIVRAIELLERQRVLAERGYEGYALLCRSERTRREERPKDRHSSPIRLHMLLFQPERLERSDLRRSSCGQIARNDGRRHEHDDRNGE
jgi:hypothetical protein